jgi:UTP--glucose-1-phosphate uridylyltransferase
MSINNKKIKKAVILAGGLNTRLYPWSKVIPKAILPLGRKVAIQYLIEECISSGIEEIYVVVRERNFIIKKYFTPDIGLNGW